MGAVPHPYCSVRGHDAYGTGVGLRCATHLGTLLVLASSVAHTLLSEADLPAEEIQPESTVMVAWLRTDAGEWRWSVWEI